MIQVLDNNKEKALEIFKNNNKGNLNLIVNMQYQLMKRLIESKNLFDYDLHKLSLVMIMALEDENVEFVDFVTDNTIDFREKTIDSMFELVDGLHFIIQFYFLILARDKGITNIRDLFKQDVENDIITKTINHFITTDFNNMFEPKVNYDFIKENDMVKTITTLFTHTSNLKNSFDWKTWKTYKGVDSYQFFYDIGQYLLLVYDYHLRLFENEYSKIYVFDENENYKSNEILTIFYIIKNIENFDRQERGY